MKRNPPLAILFAGATLQACVDRPLGPADTSTSSSGEDPTFSPTSSTGQGTPTSSGSTSTSTTTAATSDLSTEPAQSTGTNDSITTTAIPLDFGPGAQCDIYAQDCPEGQKCAWWASDGGNAWNATNCKPITGDQLPGEPCTTDGGGTSGKDDCIKGAMCFGGQCVALCTGQCGAGACADGFHCSASAECFALCIPNCDPLLQDCLEDDLCLPINDAMICVLDASGDEGQLFDPCEFANACDPGLVCAAPTSASECDPQSPGCCQPMCSISAMQPCPGANQQCLSLYEEGQAPPAFEDIGFCTLPP